MVTSRTFSLVEAAISDLRTALNDGTLTSVELVARYLDRIARYDSNGPRLNSVCVLNQRAFEEAQASDNYRASGHPPRSLEGIPYVIKDSFKVDGMTVAAGSLAFADLISSADATIVESLRANGAIVLGKTNMPAMADGGSQRGVYGRAESPYNLGFSPTAFASGSSNGTGTAVAASFASFGFAGETVSSGRAPASNNALIGYSPSRGVIPICGQWPLYPTCDVITPHTRTMCDMFDVLNVIVRDDPVPKGDFWRTQTFVHIPPSSTIRPRDYHSLTDSDALRGKRIAIPKCFIGKGDGTQVPYVFTDAVRELFDRARFDLEALGATLVETSFPILEQYNKKLYPGQSANVEGFTEDWMKTERCKFIAMAWDDFLRDNKYTEIPDLTTVNPSEIHPHVAPMDDPTLYTEAENHVRYEEMIEAVRTRSGTLYETPGCEVAVRALEAARKKDLEDWMDANDFDCVVFPTNGDVARADAEENLDSMLHALQDGVKYSNGGRALKHLGIPAITAPMGTLPETGMPVGITFCGKGWSDSTLLSYVYAYENGTKRRTSPQLTPALESDLLAASSKVMSGAAPILEAELVDTEKVDDSMNHIRKVFLQGSLQNSTEVVVLVDDQPSFTIAVSGGKWTWRGNLARPKVKEQYPTMRPVPKNLFMVRLLSKAANGRSAGVLLLVE